MTINYQALINQAVEISKSSYSPYSKFPVGAALLSDSEDEKVFVGCNIENSSYSLCLCAERAAVSQAVSAGYRKFKAIAIIAQTLKPCNPCGACLQVLAEFAPDMEIILQNPDGSPCIQNLKGFLPNMFTPDLLKRSSPLFKNEG
jgi:cytidine deaminase